MDWGMCAQRISQFWAVAEPLVWLLGIISASVYWGRVKLARRRRYANREGKQFVIALQVGRPVSEAVKAHFGELDCLIDADCLLGKNILESDKDYKKLAKEVYQAMASNQNCLIKLVLSGPVGLAFIIGQMVGFHFFEVEVYQYDIATRSYRALPMPERNWL